MIQLKRLTEEDCWRLFNRVAFLGKEKTDEENFKEIGRKIAAKCDGLPLAAKTLGSHMYFKTTKKEWEDVLESELWDLEDTNMKLFSPLLLSYYDLPSVVKRCFSYCAVFSKDALIDRDDLIQQWMSQGYFNSKKNMEKEAAGLGCFNSLVMRSFFQDFEEDMERNILQCKMHDVVHNFAQFLTKNEYYSIREMENVNQIHGGDIRHLTMAPSSTTSAEVPISILKGRSWHTLVVSGIDAIGHDQFLHMKYLRTLNLTGCNTELPEIIGELVHLRYLNLSNNRRLKELPTSVGKLWNLQTLRLVHCLNIEKLPGTVGQLINLRHLYASYSYNLMQWPKEIGRLSCLQTLNGFQCFGDDDAKNDHETNLGALRNLNNLHQLYIRGLGDAANHVDEAKQAQLHSKKGLLHLALYFSNRTSTMEIHEKVLQELNPHPNIQNLTIKQYEGLVFPSWMISLNNLRRLSLAFCSCEVLPPLGKLPCLESLKMIDMSNVVKVGPEFLGIGEVDHDNYLESSNVVSFPNLKELEFHFFDEWKEWVGTNPERWKFQNPTVIIMPRLQILNISYCDNLETLPNFLARVPLQNLSVRICPKLKMRRRKEWAKVCHIPNIAVDDLRIVVDRIREGSTS
nr:putative disease resistance protein RGA3 [Ziziphus jujuba var. spinosa]